MKNVAKVYTSRININISMFKDEFPHQPLINSPDSWNIRQLASVFKVSSGKFVVQILETKVCGLRRQICAFFRILVQKFASAGNPISFTVFFNKESQ